MYGAPVFSVTRIKTFGNSPDCAIDSSKRPYANMNPNAVAYVAGIARTPGYCVIPYIKVVPSSRGERLKAVSEAGEIDAQTKRTKKDVTKRVIIHDIDPHVMSLLTSSTELSSNC